MTGRWRDTLPDVDGFDHHDLHALDHLATALWRVGGAGMLDSAGFAAAHIRVWRKSLVRIDYRRMPDLIVDCTDERLLWLAVHAVVDAATSGNVNDLRYGEAALRTLWRRHQERDPDHDDPGPLNGTARVPGGPT